MGMTSGRLAAETIIRAKKLDNFDKQTLSYYEEQIKSSFISKDLKKYKNATKTLEKNPAYFNHYIPSVNAAMSEMFTVDGVSKAEKQKKIVKQFLNDRTIFGAAADVIKLVMAVK